MATVQFEAVNEVTLDDAPALLTPENVAFAKRVLSVEKLAKQAVTEAYANGAESKSWIEVAPGVQMKGTYVTKCVVSTVDVLKAALHCAMGVIKDRNKALYERLFALVNADSISAEAGKWGVEVGSADYITHMKFTNCSPQVDNVRIVVTDQVPVEH